MTSLNICVACSENNNHQGQPKTKSVTYKALIPLVMRFWKNRALKPTRKSPQQFWVKHLTKETYLSPLLAVDYYNQREISFFLLARRYFLKHTGKDNFDKKSTLSLQIACFVGSQISSTMIKSLTNRASLLQYMVNRHFQLYYTSLKDMATNWRAVGHLTTTCSAFMTNLCK